MLPRVIGLETQISGIDLGLATLVRVNKTGFRSFVTLHSHYRRQTDDDMGLPKICNAIEPHSAKNFFFSLFKRIVGNSK